MRKSGTDDLLKRSWQEKVKALFVVRTISSILKMSTIAHFKKFTISSILNMSTIGHFKQFTISSILSMSTIGHFKQFTISSILNRSKMLLYALEFCKSNTNGKQIKKLEQEPRYLSDSGRH